MWECVGEREGGRRGVDARRPALCSPYALPMLSLCSPYALPMLATRLLHPLVVESHTDHRDGQREHLRRVNKTLRLVGIEAID